MLQSWYTDCYRDEIRTTPEKLENLMSTKHVLAAANLLVESLKIVNNKDMMQIGALDDIRRTLARQKNVNETSIYFQEFHAYTFYRRCTICWLKKFITISTSKVHSATNDGLSMSMINNDVRRTTTATLINCYCVNIVPESPIKARRLIGLKKL